MKNMFENEYINNIDNTAPDMDKLWSRISASETDDDISAFENAAVECSKTSDSAKNIRIFRNLAAAAAVFTIIAGISISQNFSGGINETSTAEDYATGNEQIFMDDSSESEEALNVIESVSEWDYSSELGDVYEYSSLNLAETPSGIYTALSSNNEENEYFVEAEVLGRTECFVDGTVLSAQKIGESSVRYEVEVIRIISDEPITVSGTIFINSCSEYSLRINREYLIPVYSQNGDYHIVFDDAPQIEFTQNRELVFHNGWKSLSGEAHSIEYPQVYSDDYFYDRMNLAAESSLDNLFDSWIKAK